MTQDISKAFGGLADFLSAFGTGQFDNRDVVGRHEGDALCIDTCWAPDQEHFETGVEDPRYDDAMVIVETYGNDRVAATAGHERWVQALTEGEPPAELPDADLWGMGRTSIPLQNRNETGSDN